MDTTSNAWKRTLNEKVYIAKLAVLTCNPRIYITHWSRSLAAPGLGGKPGFDELEPQGFVGSLARTPFSRASCSKVIGMNDPERFWLATVLPESDRAVYLDALN
jgi:hypothetical protein